MGGGDTHPQHVRTVQHADGRRLPILFPDSKVPGHLLGTDGGVPAQVSWVQLPCPRIDLPPAQPLGEGGQLFRLRGVERRCHGLSTAGCRGVRQLVDSHLPGDAMSRAKKVAGFVDVGDVQSRGGVRGGSVGTDEHVRPLTPLKDGVNSPCQSDKAPNHRGLDVGARERS